MSDEFVLHFEHARNLFDESDMIALPEPDQAQQLALTGIGRALLAIAGELRTFNSDRSQWYREVLEVLTQAKDPDGSLRSGQPAAAPVCPECGHAPVLGEDESTPLTYEQWNHHLNSWFRWRRSEGDERAEAWRRALEEMETRFGPCPEES